MMDKGVEGKRQERERAREREREREREGGGGGRTGIKQNSGQEK